MTIPELSLVLLVGPSGAGKSTFAQAHFDAFEVLSSDHYRGVVSNDTNDQSATRDAFDTLAFVVERRLARGLLTVIDATNLQPEHRKAWVRLAKRFHVLPVAITFELPTKVCAARNVLRTDRELGTHALRRQMSFMRGIARKLKRDGVRYVHRLTSVDEVEAVEVERSRSWTDKRDQRGPFDIIGDVHGCFDELRALLNKLGYAVREVDGRFEVTPPVGRRVIFLGDLIDRGPASDRVLELAMDMVDGGVALAVPGNHEAKLLRHLNGKRVTPSHGLAETIAQLDARPDAFRERVRLFLSGLISHYVLDGGRLVVAHAGMKAEYAGRASGAVKRFALYGEPTGEVDAFGLPIRYPWARDYRGDAKVIYGHTPVREARWLNQTLCVDTGCVFGGELTALQWPEETLVSVPARETYYAPVKPLAPAAENHKRHLELDPLLNDGVVHTRFEHSVPIRPASAVQALEVLSRFSVDPRWLVHLPPTMSPVETAPDGPYLERPAEAFAYYRTRGIDEVVCQVKHMGSRAVLMVGRDAAALAERVGFAPDEAPAGGIILSRRGRRFFDDEVLEAALLDRVRRALTQAGTWEQLDTDWVILDAELMPWSAKAQSLIDQQYAPVGAAGRAHLDEALAVLRRARARHPEAEALVDRYQARADALGAYDEAWRRYVWPVEAIDDLRLAPFHVLASEGKVYDTAPHRWHLKTIAAFCAHDPILLATDHRFVSLADPDAEAAATAWWTSLVEAGGEGMVVKPADGILVRHGRRVVQPALKVRGPEYLRIIYGPEYTLPDQLERLRARHVGRKRAMAFQEMLLGLESLHRFVERRALHDIHACAFALLALESEPVDPRL